MRSERSHHNSSQSLTIADNQKPSTHRDHNTLTQQPPLPSLIVSQSVLRLNWQVPYSNKRELLTYYRKRITNLGFTIMQRYICTDKRPRAY